MYISITKKCSSYRIHIIKNILTFLVLVDLRSGCSAMLLNGTSMEYLIEWSSCTTTLLTFLKLSFRLWAAPRADRTWSVLNNSG